MGENHESVTPKDGTESSGAEATLASNTEGGV
jgi:hypothetical protein